MIIISSCLADTPCRYDGRSFPTPYTSLLTALVQSGKAMKVCPEVLGGLPTPRESAELIGERVKTASGDDVTDAFILGAEKAVEQIGHTGRPTLAVLKSRSPSCGSSTIYDGTFSGTVRSGEGVFSRLLRDTFPDLTIIDETALEDHIEFLTSLLDAEKA